jgi:hypothetical protein
VVGDDNRPDGAAPRGKGGILHVSKVTGSLCSARADSAITGIWEWAKSKAGIQPPAVLCLVGHWAGRSMDITGSERDGASAYDSMLVTP